MCVCVCVFSAVTYFYSSATTSAKSLSILDLCLHWLDAKRVSVKALSERVFSWMRCIYACKSRMSSDFACLCVSPCVCVRLGSNSLFYFGYFRIPEYINVEQISCLIFYLLTFFLFFFCITEQPRHMDKQQTGTFESSRTSTK